MAVRPSSVRKRHAVLAAAEHVFLRDGYDQAGMDQIADRSGVSKQTIYTHFGSKEALFVAVVGHATASAFDAAQAAPEVDGDHVPATVDAVRTSLHAAARRLLDAVLVPRVLDLRRLAIAEARRFPVLGEVFWSGGPARTMATTAERFARMHVHGVLRVPDPVVAARTFNWLVMADAVNRAMLLGDAALPDAAEREAIAAEATRVFLAAHGTG